MCKRVRCGLEVEKTSLLRFLDPRLVVAVAVEDDALMLLDGSLDELMQSAVSKSSLALELVGELLQLFRDRVVLRTVFAQEIEADEPSIRNSNLLPVKANGRGSVSVGRVLRELRKGVNADSEDFLLLGVRRACRSRQPRGSRRGRCRWNIETIAGGASLAPRRWSLAADATEMRSRS